MNNNIDNLSKRDNGNDKVPIILVPTQIIRDVAEIRRFGNKKYSAYSWVMVEKERYISALFRHLLAYMDDPESVDEESGIKHYKHAACNMAFICEMEREDWPLIKQKLIERDPELMKAIEYDASKQDIDTFTSTLMEFDVPNKNNRIYTVSSISTDSFCDVNIVSDESDNNEKKVYKVKPKKVTLR